MILDPRVIYPHARIYVLKFHIDSEPRKGMIFGRLEHLASGRQYHFGSTDELIASLIGTDADASFD